ncbi:cysteine-rich DPF motif domain-containing protein 1, partial [Fopius arisanus]|uniref:Cysteine-rich DPF motif domain-containing protein 1 n=1 Tax=Fopius arisanus TaxID=64838 RepID=A0A9R1TBV6_9HYME
KVSIKSPAVSCHLFTRIFPFSLFRAATEIAGEKIGERDDGPGGKFKCFRCSLEERFDYKGTKPPFSRAIVYLEECYIMKDPFTPPNKGQVLVLGGDCSICGQSVCLSCSIFYAKRFCKECANNNDNLPKQLQSKIKS